MTSRELLTDAFNRVQEQVHKVLDGLGSSELSAWVDPSANTIGWLLWHLTRIQDDHVAGVASHKQVWHEGGWLDRFSLPFDPEAALCKLTRPASRAAQVDAAR